VAVLLGIAGDCSCQEPMLAEVRLADVSEVRLTLQQETLEVQTRYGKLSVPVAEIKRIEFGLHYPAGLESALRAHQVSLGSSVHAERDAASQALLKAGHYACPMLRDAAKSTDPEVSRRAVDLLKEITEKVSPALLAIKEYDTITADYPIVGHIRAKVLKTDSPTFGAVAIKLHDLRSMQSCAGEQEVQVTVDSANQEWTATAVSLDPQMRLTVVASGSIDLWPQSPGQYAATAKGYNAIGKRGPFMAGTLIGRIGENGPVFLIGERFEGDGSDGKLWLQIVPSPWNAPSVGTFSVRITTSPR
jgi:hypothetical protein